MLGFQWMVFFHLSKPFFFLLPVASRPTSTKVLNPGKDVLLLSLLGPLRQRFWEAHVPSVNIVEFTM
ncbi:hypothetical protein Y032_0732g1915 [Ancylostoma ceylanicum]|uniref:Secreted protein n=1 Tax=Ancylostoma ceylanicum TaxID=53326 RepID=A0A016WG01_9BILA|nr:hypothetical protein Y032_0732g1915 [Ancylostoma ceylanicum]